MRYHLKERFLTVKDDFVVYDDRENAVFEVRGSFLRIGDYLRIYDIATDQEIFSIKEKVFTYQKQYMFYQNGAEVATIRKKEQPDFADNFFEVSCASGIVLQLHGNFKEWDIEIVDQYARVYVHISREFSFLGDRYTVDVPEGIDPVFVIAIAVTLDEMREDGVKTR
ncbi:MAG: LURP-one-related family protein [Ktedonobacteraceae bacterium]|nr:LURP-one-related family protein [Ktedonobacteraceae bacterium]